MMKFRVCAERPTAEQEFPYTMDPNCGNDSSSSGVISDQSSSNCGPGNSSLSLEKRSTSSLSSYSSSSRRLSASSTVCHHGDGPATPSPAASVHWGETRIHTYEREDTTDNEDILSILSNNTSTTTSSSSPPSPVSHGLENIVEIDVDKVIDESTQSPMKPSDPPQQYVETNLDATDIQCPACVFDCGPIHPYMKNSMLLPHQCIHDDSPSKGRVSNRHPSSSSLSSSDSSYVYHPTSGCTRSQAHLHCRALPISSSSEALSSHHRCRALPISSSSEALSSASACRQRRSSQLVSVAENNSPFACISKTLLTRILSHLTAPDLCRTARVCKRWYRAAWSPELWFTVSMQCKGRSIDVDRGLRAVTKILSYATYPVCSSLLRVTVHDNRLLTDKGVLALAKRCPELRSLDIRGCSNVTNLAIFELVSRCLNLEVLNVSGCEHVSCISLTPEAARQSPHPTGNRVFLRSLDMSGCSRVDDANMSIIASHCTELTHLYLRRCPLLTQTGLFYVAKYCTQLREISLNECPKLGDSTLTELSHHVGPQLKYLSMAKCNSVSDSGVMAVALKCPRLRYLNLRGCARVSDSSMEAVAESCQRLRSLDLGGCDVSDDSLIALGQYCGQLRRINLRSCDAVTDRGVEALARGCRGILLLNIHECSVTSSAHDTVRSYCPAAIIEHNNPGAFFL